MQIARIAKIAVIAKIVGCGKICKLPDYPILAITNLQVFLSLLV